MGLAIAPLLLVLSKMLSHWRFSVVVLPLVAIAGTLLLWRHWEALERHFDWIYLCQECALYGTLAALFGRTLLPGEIPLCTRWATQVHGPLPPEVRRYTRAVTLLWALFFALIVAATLLLYLLAPRRVWSLFVNLLVLPAIAALFAAEYLWRRRALPNLRHSLHDMARLVESGATLSGNDSTDARAR